MQVAFLIIMCGGIQMKKWVSKATMIFFAGLLVFISVAFARVSVQAEENVDGGQSLLTTGSEETISRAEWLTLLAETFTMVVEDDYYPDN